MIESTTSTDDQQTQTNGVLHSPQFGEENLRKCLIEHKSISKNEISMTFWIQQDRNKNKILYLN